LTVLQKKTASVLLSSVTAWWTKFQGNYKKFVKSLTNLFSLAELFQGQGQGRRVK